MYIEINGEKYPCKCSTFHTQMGKDAVRIISEAPIAEGFRIVGEDDSVVADYSDYVYLYRTEGETIKEYTQEEDEIIPAIGYTTGIPESPIQRQFDSVNRRIADITPYEQTKTAYHGEIEKVFYGVPQGCVTVFFDNYSGEYSAERIEDRLTVKFGQRLTDKTTVSIIVQ